MLNVRKISKRYSVETCATLIIGEEWNKSMPEGTEMFNTAPVCVLIIRITRVENWKKTCGHRAQIKCLYIFAYFPRGFRKTLHPKKLHLLFSHWFRLSRIRGVGARTTCFSRNIRRVSLDAACAETENTTGMQIIIDADRDRLVVWFKSYQDYKCAVRK